LLRIGLRAVGAGVIARLGAHDEFAEPLALRLDFDAAVSAGAARVGGFVADHVLVADVPGNGFADLVDFVKSLGEKGDAPGSLGHGLQATPRSPLLLLSQNSNRVDSWPILFLEAPDRLLERLATGVVL